MPILDDEQRLDWLRLIKTENIGPATFRSLLERFGSARKALAALPKLSHRGGLGRTLKIYDRVAAEKDIEMATAAGARFVATGEPGYPPLLRFIDGAPPLLCIKGDPAFAERDAVSIVGSRNASAAGRKFARGLAAEIAAAGYLVVSGLARGIDTATHEGALSGGTAAILAGGIDTVYPPENAALQAKIGEAGLLITEMTPGTMPRPDHFPRRNRIISGISRAIVVVEAAARSGSLITARLAGEQGRDVFAVPGSPLDPRSEGTNKLIKNGAALLTTASDVLESLQATPRPLTDGIFPESDHQPKDSIVEDDERSRIVALIGYSPIGVDDLVRESGSSVAVVVSVLLELELAGKTVRHGRQVISLL